MKSKTIAAAIALFGISGFACANNFSDVPIGHWSRPFVDAMVQRGIASGYSDGTFRPDQALTRAELATMAVRLYSLDTRPSLPDRTGNPPFTDISTHWARVAIGHAWRTGVLNGYPDNTFRPDQNLTRAELAATLDKAVVFPSASTGVLQRFSDQSAVPTWARDPLARAIARNALATGNADPLRIRAQENATRGETMAMMYQTLRFDPVVAMPLVSPRLQGVCRNDDDCATGQTCNAVSVAAANFCSVPARGSTSGALPILMYHDIVAANPVGNDVTEAQFRQQMTWLRDNNFAALSTDQAIRYLLTGVNPVAPKRPVLLTFDDVYIGNYTFGWPIMRDTGMRGAFFAHTNFVGTGGSGGVKLKMSWNQLREVSASGIVEVHSHTKRHPPDSSEVPQPLADLPEATKIVEIRDAAQALFAQNLSPGSILITYPRGSYNADVQTIARWHHRAAFRVAAAPAALTADQMALPRIGISFNTTMAQFQELINRAPVN